MERIKSVKNLDRTVDRLNLKILNKSVEKPEYFDKIPGVIFSKDASDIPDIIEFIKTKVKAGKISKEEIPDVIFSMDKGLLFYSPYFQHTSFFNNLNPKQKNIFKNEVFMHYCSNEKHINLLLFLIVLLNFETPYIKMSDFFIKKYFNIYSSSLTGKYYHLFPEKVTGEMNEWCLRYLMK